MPSSSCCRPSLAILQTKSLISFSPTGRNDSMHQSLIIQHLFQVNSLEDVSRERLETFVEEYPSFGIGHYLLSRKLQKEDAGGFEQKTQLTCLYFSNPFWLQWLLENTDVGGQKLVPEARTFAALPLQEAMPHPAVADNATPVVQEWS